MFQKHASCRSPFLVNGLSVRELGIQEHPEARMSSQKNGDTQWHLVFLNKRLNLKQKKKKKKTFYPQFLLPTRYEGVKDEIEIDRMTNQ